MVDFESGIHIEWVKEGEEDVIVVKAADGKTIFTCQKLFWDISPFPGDEIPSAILRDSIIERARKLYG